MTEQGFGGTVVGGIQDISALLPLLGTEQCEEHVGSALEKGFLYSSVTPISIFGSLGIVQAGFNILVASTSIHKFNFLGAKELKNGGFNPKGDVAPMIAFDRKHPRRFLAESQLETMLAAEHIQKAENLTVSWKPGIFWWNFNLSLFSVAFASFGLLPYIALIRESNHPNGIPFLFTGWGFPVLRVLGSVLCVIVSQLLIQMRILVILKTRLLFMTIDQHSLNPSITRVFSEFKEKKKPQWNANIPSETCIWELEKWLFDSGLSSAGTSDLNPGPAREFYALEFSKHFGSISKNLRTFLHGVLSFLLIVGVLLTIGGYIGCFYLIQHTSENSSGPFLWLVLEAILSIIRILVWAFNPSWDDSKGVLFKLKLARHPPPITCTKSHREILNDGLIPVTRAEDFLQDVVAYKGPFSLVKWSNVELYYVLKANDTDLSSTLDLGKDIPGILYIVVSNYKEQSSRLIFKDLSGCIHIYICALVFGNQNTTIDVKVDLIHGATGEKTHSFTADEKAMHELVSHYEDIVSLLSDPSIKTDSFGSTWAMRHLTVIQKGKNPTYRILLTLGWMYQICFAGPFRSFKRSNVSKKLPDIEYGSEDKMKTVQHQVEVQNQTLADSLNLDLFGSVTGDNNNGNEEEDEDEEGNYKKEDTRNLIKNGLEQGQNSTEKNYILTAPDKARLRQAHLEERCSKFCLRLEDWIERYMKLYKEELLKDRPIPTEDGIEDWVREAEAREVCFVLAHCLASLEYFLYKIEEQLREYLGRGYDNMMEQFLKDTFRQHFGPLEAEEKHRQDRLMDRLEAGRDRQLELQKTKDKERKLSRSKVWGEVMEFDKMDGPWEEIESDLKGQFTLRLSQDQRKITDKQIGTRAKDNDRTLKQFTNHCEDRIGDLIYRLKSQEQEFNDVSKEMVSIISGPPTTQEPDSTQFERRYWTDKSLEERLRILKYKYLYFEYTSINAVGGPQNLARALKRSRPFTFIDFDRVERQLTMPRILSIINDVKSITGVYLLYSSKELECNIQEAVTSNVQRIVAKELDAYTFTGIETYQVYGGAQSPLGPASSYYPNIATCTVTFHIHDLGQDHTLTLKHRCRYDPEEVHFALNGHDLDSSLDCGLRVSSDFVYQDIPLPASQLNKVNTFTISFPRYNPWEYQNYLLADVCLPVLAIPNHMSSRMNHKSKVVVTAI